MIELMIKPIENDVRQTIERVKEGYLGAQEAAEHIISAGYLAIGSFRPREVYETSVSLSRVHMVDGEFKNTNWAPRYVNERSGIIRVVRASRLAETAVWGALGDINTPLMHTPLLPEDRVYDLGATGWIPDVRTGVYRFAAHNDLITAAMALRPEEVIGAIDFVPESPDAEVPVPNEPGHVMLTAQQTTAMSLPVRAGDVQPMLAAATTRYHDYEPLSR